METRTCRIPILVNNCINELIQCCGNVRKTI